jgi:nucleotide-binding universal stress UspA family protein
MTLPVTVGYDGSPQSHAAAEWAACEALSRRLPLQLVYVWDWQPYTTARKAEEDRRWAEQLPRTAARQLSTRYPRLEIEHERISGYATDVLPVVAKHSELLALGSRALSGVAGFLLGSVAQETVARASGPVVLVRAGHAPEDEHLPAYGPWSSDSARGPERGHPGEHGGGHPQRAFEPGSRSTATAYRDVLLGMDPAKPRDEVMEFAFAAAVHRAARLRVVHGWRLPSALSRGHELPDRNFRSRLEQQETELLVEALQPWREKFPHVEVEIEASPGSASQLLVDGSADASLVVVGRREHGPRGPRIGPTAHAVLHQATAPVAVVPHM